MNQLTLSSDINVITAEINSYKQVAGQAIFEIGKRLKHVKENDLVHGEFGKWLESVEMDRRRSAEFIKVYEEFNESNVRSLGHLGLKALYQIATLPEEEREKEHELESGETKQVDEMTVRELEEVKRKNKELEQAKQQAEAQAEQARKSERIMQNRLEEAEDKEPEVIEREIIKEVIPDDLQHELDSTKRVMDFTSRENDKLKKELDSYKLKDTSNFDEEQAGYELKKIHHEADRSTAEIRLAFKQMNDKISVSKYMHEAISVGNDYEKRKLKDEMSITRQIINNIEASLNNRREIN